MHEGCGHCARVRFRDRKARMRKMRLERTEVAFVHDAPAMQYHDAASIRVVKRLFKATGAAIHVDESERVDSRGSFATLERRRAAPPRHTLTVPASSRMCDSDQRICGKLR